MIARNLMWVDDESCGRENITTYEHISHPYNIKYSTPYKFMAKSSQMTWIGLIQGFKANFSVIST